jgi:hypothetical protein
MEYIVMDDDSTMMNILQWDYDKTITAGQMLVFPRTTGGRKKPNKGGLPTMHPPWTRLANHNHQLRCLAGMIYKLVHASLNVSLCITAPDAERLKCNCCYVGHEFKSCNFPTFKHMVWEVLHHHFGCHDTCGDWCTWLHNKDNPKALKKLHYFCKIKDAALYQQILTIWESYCSDEALHDLHHE